MRTVEDARAFMERARLAVERERAAAWAYETAGRLADALEDRGLRGRAEDVREEARARMERHVGEIESLADVMETVGGVTESRLLLMRYMDGMPWRDVAEALGMSESGAMSAHRRALASVASSLDRMEALAPSDGGREG